MILQALSIYYRRLAAEHSTDVAPEGFEQKEIPFLIIIDQHGKFVDIQDTRIGEGKKKRGRIFIVPKAVKRSSNIEANLLWDTPNYVFARPKPDLGKDAKQLQIPAREQHQYFLNVLHDRFPEPVTDGGVRAVLAFLEQKDFTPVFTHPLWPEVEQSGANVTFKVNSDTGLVCQRPGVIAAIAGLEGSGDKQTCLVTGELDFPVRLHTAVKGVRNAQTSGANIISFNLDAFRSYGKEQGLNAPVGQKAEFAYTTALNHMLARDSRQKIQVGDATTVFWAEKKHNFESAFAQFFGYEPKGEPEQDYKSLIALFRSPESGARSELDPDTGFYVLGLSPNAARASDAPGTLSPWRPGWIPALCVQVAQECTLTTEHVSQRNLAT